MEASFTGGYQDAAVTHDTTHESGSITPPRGMGCDVAVQMTLTLVLDVEREDVAREVFPCRAAVNAAVAVFEDMADAILKIGDGIWVPIPELHIVVARSAAGAAVQCREMILLDVGVVSPAAKLVAVMQGDDELDVYTPKLV